MLLELTLRRTPPHPPDGSPADGIRLLARLPSRWRADLASATGEVVLRVRCDGATRAQVQAEVERILTDPAVASWSLVGCREVPGPPLRETG